MRISANVQNSSGENTVMLRTGNNAHGLRIAARPSGFGSSVSGGELLFLALATCYCNDIYREAAKLNIQIDSVEVEVSGDFGGEGERASNVTYRAKVKSPASEAEVRKLMQHTDKVSEIQNTLRMGIPVVLSEVQVVAA
jgi:uncharacterized OsmC-like protein